MTIYPSQDIVVVGCFEGTISDFLDAVEEKHGDNEFGRQYKKIIEMVVKK